MTGNALNVLYPLDSSPPSVDLWNFELNRTRTVETIQAGELLQNDYRGLTFSMGSADDLVFYFLPEGGCLWVLSPLDANNAYLPAENSELVTHSNLGNIFTTPEKSNYPPSHIFGAEPRHDWCYYFEKADLARQESDWPQVINLMEEAQKKGFKPNYGIEWLPLVTAEVATEDWTQAVETSQRIHDMHARNDSMLCATWESMLSSTSDFAAAQESFHQVSAFANCNSQ